MALKAHGTRSTATSDREKASWLREVERERWSALKGKEMGVISERQLSIERF